MNIPEIHASYDKDNLAWCSIYHTCPSNIIWIQTLNGVHLFPKAWVPEDGPATPLDDVRSDGMVWNRVRKTALCGYTNGKFDPIRATIGLYKHDACPECWEKRW